MAYVADELQSRFNRKNLLKEAAKIEGQIYRQVDTRRTLRFTLGNNAYFLKLHSGVGWAEIFKNLVQLRPPVLGARNEWQALLKLRKAGIDTLEPLAYVTEGLNPATQRSCLITRALEDTLSLEDLCRQGLLTTGLKFRLIRRVATIARQLHDIGVNHRDLYICHFLISKADIKVTESPVLKTLNAENGTRPVFGSTDNPRLFLIDLHRAQIRRDTPLRWRVKDVGALYFSGMVDAGLTLRDVLRFMKSYSGTSLRQTLVADRSFWSSVQARAEALYLESYPELPALMSNLGKRCRE